MGQGVHPGILESRTRTLTVVGAVAAMAAVFL